jgi:hypothetical protein
VKNPFECAGFARGVLEIAGQAAKFCEFYMTCGYLPWGRLR